MDKQCRSIRLLLMLTIIVVMTLISVLFIMHRDALTCPLCWKEGLWLVKRWVEEIIFRPKELVCNRGRFCKSNFVQIALAIKLYASDHGGFYLGLALQEGYSPFLFREGDTFWLFYQVSMGRHRETAIVCRSSKDLQNWSERKIG